jgi:hypothetical protein
MPTFTDLRADYPLILTLSEPAYPCALTWFYIARLTSVRTIPVVLIRRNHPVPVKTYTSFCSNFCSSACAPSASESTWRLTPSHASLREFQPHADEHLVPPIESQCANLRGSTEFDFRESAVSCRPNQRNVRSSKSHAVARLSQAEFDGRSVLRFCRHSVACLFTDSLDKADQVRRSTSCLEAEEQ